MFRVTLPSPPAARPGGQDRMKPSDEVKHKLRTIPPQKSPDDSPYPLRAIHITTK